MSRAHRFGVWLRDDEVNELLLATEGATHFRQVLRHILELRQLPGRGEKDALLFAAAPDILVLADAIAFRRLFSP